MFPAKISKETLTKDKHFVTDVMFIDDLFAKVDIELRMKRIKIAQIR